MATENTLEAFRAAQAIGYCYIEIDVQLTRDNVVVVFHDSTLNRLAGRPDYISDLTWAEIKDIELRGGGTIPRLDEVLEQFPDLKFNIDPKTSRAVSPLASILQNTESVDRVCVGSFSSSRVRAMQRLVGPDLCTSPGWSAIPWVLVRAILAPRRPSRYACVQIPNILRARRLAKWFVQRIQQAGLQVHLWTPNTEQELQQAISIGVDGIITDEIELLQRVLESKPITSSK